MNALTDQIPTTVWGWIALFGSLYFFIKIRLVHYRLNKSQKWIGYTFVGIVLSIGLNSIFHESIPENIKKILLYITLFIFFVWFILSIIYAIKNGPAK